MKRLSFLILSLMVVLAACSDDNQERELSAYEEEVIDYFQEVALGFEFGGATEITRKWSGSMKIYVGGTLSTEMLTELKSIIDEINGLASDGFSIEYPVDSIDANYYLFLGTGDQYADLYPSQANLVGSNFGLFSIYWDGNNNLNRGHMYVDLERASAQAQLHLLREELTQSLGLGRDSDRYIESIFQSTWTENNAYADIDRDLIRLLYHPDVTTGLNATEVETVLMEILKEE